MILPGVLRPLLLAAVVCLPVGAAAWGDVRDGAATTPGAASEPAPPGIVDLAGQWRVFAGNNPSGSIPDLDDSSWRPVMLPGDWEELGLSSHRGLVWFRRQVDLPSGWRERSAPSGVAVLVGAAPYGAYELYAGGQLVGDHGRRRAGFSASGVSGAGAAGRGLPAAAVEVFRIPRDVVEPDGRLQLALAFRRAVWPRDRLTQSGGPVGRQVLFGDFDTLSSVAETARFDARRQHYPAIALAVLLAAVGLYHFQLFLLRRRSVEYLWFGILALSFAALAWAVGDPNLSEGLQRRLSAVLGHVSVALLLRFLGLFLARPVEKWLRGYQLSHVVLAVAAAIVPLGWLAASQPLRWLWCLPFVLWLGGLLVDIVRRGTGDVARAEVAAICCGALLIPLAALAALALEMGGVRPAVPLPPLAYNLMAAAMVVAVSGRFTRAHRQLDRFRQQLEQMVEDQTDELGATHRKLQSEASERKLVEEAMRMLERAVEQSIDGIAVTDPAGGTQFVNESFAQMHGYEVFEVLGYDLTLFHTTEQMQEQVYPLMRQVREDGAFQGEIWHRKKDGAVFPTWTSATRLMDPGGEAVGMVAIARDVSARRKASEEQLRLEERAQQAERLGSLASLAAGIAHDYNNLLTGVLGNTSLVLRELPADSLARRKIRQIETAAERAATLSDQLLAYAGEDQLTLRTLEINELVNGMREELTRKVSSQVELDFDLNDALPPVDIDQRQIRQVILNLFKNACESIDDDRGVITLRTSKIVADRAYFEGAVLDEGHPEGEYVLFEVSDSGCGIDEETQALLFDPFYTTRGIGRGLGLATVLGIVRAHGGAIKIYSQVGRGTTFEVLLPASTKRPVPIGYEEPLQKWKGLGTVLVADDERLVREVSKDILEGHDFKVFSAEDGREAVEVFRRHRDEIRVVLIDLTMPNLDGEGAFREIRSIDPQATVILMSGYSLKRAGEGLSTEGLAGFLHKPFRPDDLIRIVREVLEA